VSPCWDPTLPALPGFGVAPGTWSASTRGGPGRIFERFLLGLRRCRYHETETANKNTSVAILEDFRYHLRKP
jgi:hypothetical protein